MPRDVYPHDHYPPFCHGAMVTASYEHVRVLYELSLVTDFHGFFLEDLLIFGILRHKTGSSRFQTVAYGYAGRAEKSRFDSPLVRHLGPLASLAKYEKKMLLMWDRQLGELVSTGKVVLRKQV